MRSTTPVPPHRRHDRHRDDVLSRAHVRARGGSARRRGADGRLRRGDGPQARHRAPDPDDHRDERRREPVGVPLLERGTSRSLFFSTSVDHLRALHPEVGVPEPGLGRVAARRLGAARDIHRARGTRSRSRAGASSTRVRTSSIPFTPRLPDERRNRSMALKHPAGPRRRTGDLSPAPIFDLEDETDPSPRDPRRRDAARRRPIRSSTTS